MEIACDESGHEGSRLVGGVTDVFAHASVRSCRADAEECIAELRRRIRSPALEYKANHLLRVKHRGTLLWLFGPDGPLHGHAHVQLVDKTQLFLRSTGATDPLVPAIVVAVELWSDGGRVPVDLVHDRQTVLTDDRIACLLRLPGLASLTLVDSRTDARVQLADFLAGVARRVASDQLAGRADPELVELLRPYGDPPPVRYRYR